MAQFTLWQQRMQAAGLSQQMLARLLGYSEVTMSRQLNGYGKGNPEPHYVIQAIRAWEIMTPKQRERWLAEE